jgi:hypothetical protein
VLGLATYLRLGTIQPSRMRPLQTRHRHQTMVGPEVSQQQASGFVVVGSRKPGDSDAETLTRKLARRASLRAQARATYWWLPLPRNVVALAPARICSSVNSRGAAVAILAPRMGPE